MLGKTKLVLVSSLLLGALLFLYAFSSRTDSQFQKFRVLVESATSTSAGQLLSLKIDGLSVASPSGQFIELNSFSWGESPTSPKAGCGEAGSAGKSQMADFHFTMKASAATPKLMLACAGGDHFPKATLEVCKKTATPSGCFLRYSFDDVVVTTFRTQGSTDSFPQDEISLSFSKIKIDYQTLREDGTVESTTSAGWDLQKKKPIF